MKLNYQLMTAQELAATLDRLADEILNANNGRPVVLLGIQRRGVPMARRIAVRITEKAQREPQIGSLDINLYRDDLTRVAFQPVVRKTDVPPHIDDKDVILVDDVLYTGRTIRSALDALCDFGRMRTIQLAVLIDRGHRELPIEANFVGKTITTKDNEVVEVKLTEIDGEDGIYVMEKI
ncbi:MAG: bifunctional pyr operon transcriptional regulator/uracil phosphoribosyltransferase PyrR [Acidobacteria bacterium]|nr:MAG: bifunctional pyr operon transcriptional regulator/uracil phosphoribosyltransferase PyrR [Acidobacteriota bacterium]